VIVIKGLGEQAVCVTLRISTSKECRANPLENPLTSPSASSRLQGEDLFNGKAHLQRCSLKLERFILLSAR
jgi:hypothetical protein